MKKLDFFKVFLAAMVVVLFVAGCGDMDEEKDKITIPKEPPAVSGGSLTKGGDGENLAVTQESAKDFIKVFFSALGNYHYYEVSGGTRALPEQYEKETESGNRSYIRYGNYYGRAELAESYLYEYKLTETNETGTEYESGTIKYFDFSNNGELFLGGAIGFLLTDDTNDFDGYMEKANGKINFAGKYRGTVFFDDVALKRERIYNSEYDWDYGYERVRGSFYVQSAGGQRISLPDSLIYDFVYPYSDSIKYPDGQITVNKMPAVPNVTGGALSNHSGNNAAVTEYNEYEFLSAFINEFYDSYYNAPRTVRAVNEEKGTEEWLERGRKSGYYIRKVENIWQKNNSGYYWSGTGSVEYHDYSNKGVLYFGGGYGMAAFGESTEEDNETTTIKGTVKFNGEFKGELVFDNFKYKSDFSYGSYSYTYTYVGGTVKIGTLDVTQKYLDEIGGERY